MIEVLDMQICQTWASKHRLHKGIYRLIYNEKSLEKLIKHSKGEQKEFYEEIQKWMNNYQDISKTLSNAWEYQDFTLYNKALLMIFSGSMLSNNRIRGII